MASVVTVFVMAAMLTLARPSAGSDVIGFRRCYKPCYTLCVAKEGTVFNCPLKCIKLCRHHPPPRIASPALEGRGSSGGAVDDPRYFCNLGCSTSTCGLLSTGTDLAEEKVDRCVDSCSGICSKY